MKPTNLKVVLWIKNDINTSKKNEPYYPADYVAGLLTTYLINPTKQRNVFIMDHENNRTGIVLLEFETIEPIANTLIPQIENNKNFSNIEVIKTMING